MTDRTTGALDSGSSRSLTMLLYALLYNLVLAALLGLCLLTPFPDLAMAGTAGFLIGAALGSCLHLVLFRLRVGMSVTGSASFCPGCRRLVPRRHNIPIVSWIWLRGRCPGCGISIPWHYPAAELGAALIMACAAVLATWAMAS